MATKTKIALAAAIVLGAASAALASEREEGGGGPVQTWQDVQRDQQAIQRQIQNQYHLGNGGNAYGLAPSAVQKHRSR
jgi:hypothetical protein